MQPMHLGPSVPAPISRAVALVGEPEVRFTVAVLSRDQLLQHCLTLPGAWPDQPWEGDVVAKVADKIFAFLGEGSVGVKAGRSRDEADEWLDRYPGDATVMAYIGRYGWNTLRVGGAIDDAEVLESIEASYADVVARLPRSKRP